MIFVLNSNYASLATSGDDLHLVERVLAALTHPSGAVKCVAAWCARTLAHSLPALISPLLDTCLDRLSLVRHSCDALLGYGYACAALLGAVRACPLGVPHLKPQLAFNVGEELLRIAAQSNSVQLALHKTATGLCVTSQTLDTEKQRGFWFGFGFGFSIF